MKISTLEFRGFTAQQLHCIFDGQKISVCFHFTNGVCDKIQFDLNINQVKIFNFYGRGIQKFTI